jgi:hypothetical protein
MKVFNAYDSAVKKNGAGATRGKGVEKNAETSNSKVKDSVKPSKNEILNKVEAKKKDKNVEKLKNDIDPTVKVESDEVEITPKAKKIQETKVAKSKETKVSQEKPEEEDLKSDVGLNNPNDPTTKVKLKEALSNGAINFNPNERKVIEQILSQES